MSNRSEMLGVKEFDYKRAFKKGKQSEARDVIRYIRRVGKSTPNLSTPSSSTSESGQTVSGAIHALPKVIRGKGVEIRIDAPFLSDPAALARACSEGLSRVAEAIQRDVVMVRRDVFADSPGSGKIGASRYPDADSYYSSGMIPFWRGGLLGSFQYVGETTPFDHELTFTSSYASKIEYGGGFGMVPVEWVRDKIDKDADADIVVYSTKMHPFMEAVAEKLNDNLLNFGYLDIFSTHFLASLKG